MRILMLACLVSAVSGQSPGPPSDQQLTVVESLPVVDFGLKPIPGNYNTTHALVGLVDSAQHTLDITAVGHSQCTPNGPLEPILHRYS